MRRNICAVIVVSCLFMAGFATSATIGPKIQMTKDTNLHITMVTDDVLVMYNVVGENGIKGIAERIRRYTASKLNGYSIKVTDSAIAKGDSILTINIDTIEPDSLETKITYSAKLISSDGSTLFVLNNDSNDKHIDHVIEAIGNRIIDDVVKFYKD